MSSGKYGDERVLVVSRELFEDLGAFQGVNRDIARYLSSFLEPANNHFMERGPAEDDPSFKQLIPYALFHFEGKYLHYVRGQKSGESRLASKGSIGIGGHINPHDEGEDSLGETMYYNGVEREINEELKIGGGYKQRIVALINDDSSEVGQVHLGVVHIFDLDSPEVGPNEAIIEDLQFLSPGELHDRRDRLETWSQICLDGIINA